MKPIHVVHLVHSFGIGGLENGIVNLANRMAPKLFKVSIISLTNALDSKARITRKDVDCLVVGKNDGVTSQKGTGNDWRLPFKLARFFKSGKADIIHTHGWGTFLEGLLAAKLAGIPTLIHGEHGTDQLDLARRKIAYRIGIRGVDRILTVCENIRKRFIRHYGIPEQKILTILNGVDTSFFKPDKTLRQATRLQLSFKNDDIVIGTIGRLCSDKNYETLVKVMALVAREHSKVHLVFVGDGPDKKSLMEEVTGLGLENRVRFLGTRYDRLELLNAMDIFILTSISEGLPNTLLEAMSVGLPVVATTVGGIPEVVRTSKEGFLVEPRNPRGLAKPLEQLLQSSELRESIGRAGQRRIRSHFSLEKMVCEYENMYLAKGRTEFKK